MFFDFAEQFDMYNVVIEIQVDGQTQVQNIGAPKIVIIQQFLDLIQQAINSNQRVMIRMTNYVSVYSDKTGEERNMPSTLEFKNNPYLNNK